MFTIGWDPSRKGFHALVLVDEDKAILGEWKVKGFEAAYKIILRARAEASRCGTALQVGYEQDNSVNLDKLYDYRIESLYALAPRRVKSYKDAAAITDKTDFLDGYACACFLIDWRPKLQPYRPLSPFLKKAKQIADQLDHIRAQKTEAWERLWDVIDRVSPDVKRIIGDSRETQWFLQVLSHMVGRMKHTGFPGFLKFCRKKTSRMHESQLRLLHAELKLVEKEGLEGLITPKAKMIQLLLEEKKHWERLAGQALTEWDDAWILNTIKGMGAATQIRLAAHLGTNWDKWNPNSIAKYGGIAPTLWATGVPDEATLLSLPRNKRKRLSIHLGHRVACNKRLKSTLTLFALYSLAHHEWAKEAYDGYRARGQKHWEALRNLAIKWVRIFCALLREKKAYNEYTHRSEIWRRTDPLRVPHRHRV